jgi:very-short-patch-repair endonuclease
LHYGWDDSLSLRERVRVRESIKLLPRARKLRRDSTDAEKALWRLLRGRQLHGFKFRRQVILEPYIVDFVCFDAKLIIEADGGQHAANLAYDSERAAQLEFMGYRVIRFWNHEILKETEAVLEKIEAILLESPSPRPSP